MAEDTKAAKHDKRAMMAMDQEGLTAFSKPRPLIEPRPFPSNERGQLVATASDGDPNQAARKQPFVLEEPKPK
jgi:hypothetical protein